MDYCKTMQAEAEKTVKPLAEKVQTLKKQKSVLANRIRDARDGIEHKEKAIAKHHEKAGEQLTKSTSAFHEWEGRQGRLKRELASGREALALLESKLGPEVDRELATAVRDLQRAAVAVVAAARPDCERAMAEHLSTAVDLRVAFLAAGRKLFERAGVGWTGESSDHERIIPEPQIYRPHDAAYLLVYGLVSDPIDKQFVPPALRPPEPPELPRAPRTPEPPTPKPTPKGTVLTAPEAAAALARESATRGRTSRATSAPAVP